MRYRSIIISQTIVRFEGQLLMAAEIAFTFSSETPSTLALLKESVAPSPTSPGDEYCTTLGR